jgi:peptidoglycan LD-endopeptidase CwlK
MTFKLSNRSLEKLEGVDDALVAVVKHAIGISKIDFGVICGMRTIQEQEELVAKGASQTMKSKHLDGKAVDLMAYIGSRASWELNLYDDIADAIAIASRDIGVAVTWGAAWQIPDIGKFDGTMEQAMNEYVDLRRSQGKRPFIDGPHFQT